MTHRCCEKCLCRDCGMSCDSCFLVPHGPVTTCVWKKSLRQEVKSLAIGLTIGDLMREAAAHSMLAGFWDTPRPNAVNLALIHSEVSEALECDRVGNMVRFAEELADVMIRVADLAARLNLDLEKAIVDKLKHNKTRDRMHGGKLY